MAEKTCPACGQAIAEHRCRRCGRSEAEGAKFWPSKRAKDGLRPDCAECEVILNRARLHQYYLDHKQAPAE